MEQEQSTENREQQRDSWKQKYGGPITVAVMSTEQSVETTQQWNPWKRKYGKSYSEAEDAEKKRAWEATLAKVTAHNQKYDQGLVSYRLGMNQFAVEGPRLMSTPMASSGDPGAPPFEETLSSVSSEDQELPSSIDYRNRGMVTSVKGQGGCGCCYAFAAVGVLEAAHSMTNGKLVSLSAQQLVDCSGNDGCEGGRVDTCFEYAKGGLATDEEYPYQEQQGPCHNNVYPEVRTKDFYAVNDESLLERAVGQIAPVAVGLHIPDDFSLIDNDVDVYDNQEPGVGWHAVLVVGYGTNQNGVDYWTIKNSWGVNWGGRGYARIKKGVNLLDIGNDGSIASVKYS